MKRSHFHRVTILSLLLVVGALRAEERPFGLNLVGTWPGYLAGHLDDLVVRGNHAYATLNVFGNGPVEGALAIFDVSDPANPNRLGGISAPWQGKLALVGNFAYMFTGVKGMMIVDVSNPSMPVTVQTNRSLTFASGIAISGNYAYVAASCLGTQVIDISDPMNPVLTRTLLGSVNQFYDVAAVGSHLYLAVGVNNCQPDSWASGELWIMSLSNPAAPALLGRYPSSKPALRVCVEEPYALVAVAESGVNILDITNPLEPRRVGSFGTRFLNDMVVSNRLAYLAEDSQFRIVDFQVPANPVQMLQMDIPAKSVLLYSNDVYIGTQNGFEARHLADLAIRVGGYETVGSCVGITIDGPNAFLALPAKGLHILDVSNPSRPRFVGRSDDCKRPFSSFVANGLAFVADGTNGLVVLDIRNPEHPATLGRLSSPFAFDVALDGNLAYVSSMGLDIIEVSSPSRPVRIAYLAYPQNTFEVAIKGNYAYLAAGNGGLRIIDVSKPTNPQLAATCATNQGNYAQSIALTDGYAFVANGHIEIIDIRDPRNPVQTGSFHSTYLSSVAVLGRYGFAAGNNTFVVFDHSDPAQPQFVALDYRLLLDANSVLIAKHYAWVANGDGGLAVLGLDQPGIAAPAELALTREGAVMQLTVLGQPGRTHVLQEAKGLNTPMEWIDVLTDTPASGVIEVARPIEQGENGGFFRVLSE